MRRSWSLGVGSATLLVAQLGCKPPSQAAPTETTVVGGADQVLTGVTTNLAVDGRRKNYVVADSAFLFQEAQRMEFARIRVTIFDAEGQPAATLSSRRAVYTIGNRFLDARGDVLVVTPRGDTLRSARVTYDNDRRQFGGDSAFVFTGKAGLVSGKGFTADDGLRNVAAGRKRP